MRLPNNRNIHVGKEERNQKISRIFKTIFIHKCVVFRLLRFKIKNDRKDQAAKNLKFGCIRQLYFKTLKNFDITDQS